MNAIRSDTDHVPIICLVDGYNGTISQTEPTIGMNCGMSTGRGGVLIVNEKEKPVLAFKERAGKPGGGKGILIGENKAFTLSTLQDEAICFEAESIGHDIRSTQFSRGGCCDTLTANDYKDPVIVCYTATRFAEYKETLPTLRAAGGDLSQGGSEGLIVTRKANDEDIRDREPPQ